MSEELETSAEASDAARALGKLGASKGGRARAKSLSPERRKEIARKAIEARWEKAKAAKEPLVLKATHAGVVKIGDIELPCAVLEDGTRVFTQQGFLRAIGRSENPPGRRGDMAEQLPPFLSAKGLKPFISKELEETSNPVHFLPIRASDDPSKTAAVGNRGFAYGYKVELLPLICNVYLDARNAMVLKSADQLRIAARCELLIRGLATVGIIALVDEATGYQYDRARRALEAILEKYVSKELARWSRTFEVDFYENMFRLKGWRYTVGSTKRPIMAAQLTLDIVYRRLAPGVLEELQRLSPKDGHGRRKSKLFQRLSVDFGHPKLKEHLAAVTALMKSEEDGQYETFEKRLNRALPRYEPMPLFDRIKELPSNEAGPKGLDSPEPE
jgi:P63C domain